MRILALVTDAFGGHGGIAQYNRDLLTSLSSSSRTHHIVCLPRHAARPIGPIPEKIQQCQPVPGRLAYSLAAARIALSRPAYDLVFCGHVFHMPLAAIIARLSGAPLWLQIHGVEAWTSPGRAVPSAVRRVDVVTSVSRYTRDRFLEWANVDTRRIDVLPNTFNPRYTPGPKPLDLMNRHGLGGRKIILTVSRLSAQERYKGHDKIIAVLPLILRHHPDATYLIVGDGDDRPRLEQIAADNGVSSRVLFAGRVPDDSLIDYYRLADVFAMPSTGEGFGIVYLEAAATGLPVIAGNRDGSVDALANGAIGILIDPDSPEQLSAALMSALNGGRHAVGDPTQFSVSRFASNVDDFLGRITSALIR